jgi:hypothetical protein
MPESSQPAPTLDNEPPIPIPPKRRSARTRSRQSSAVPTTEPVSPKQTKARKQRNPPPTASAEPEFVDPNASTTAPVEQPRSISRSRARVGKGKKLLPPADSELNGNLEFTDLLEQNRYKQISKLPIVPCKSIDIPTLDALKVKSEVFNFVANIGWETYFNVNLPAYIELCREFYTTFVLDLSEDFNLGTPGVIRFRLLGQRFNLSINDFNAAMGFVNEEELGNDDYLAQLCDFDDHFDPLTVYRGMTNRSNISYDSGSSKDYYVHSPSLKYIHRFLAFSFSGRKDSPSVMSKTELFFLWCMINKLKVNLGFWMATQFSNALFFHRPLILGSYITHFALNAQLFSLDNNNLHKACDMPPLDLKSLDDMGLLHRENGIICFAPPGPLVPRHLRVFTQATQVHPAASPSETTTNRMTEERLQSMETTWDQIDQNLIALCQHMGIPHVPRP